MQAQFRRGVRPSLRPPERSGFAPQGGWKPRGRVILSTAPVRILLVNQFFYPDICATAQMATDLADYLVNKGIPFRDAHEVVGKSVAFGIKEGRDLSELTLGELQQFSKVIEGDVFVVLSLEGSVNARKHTGGTAPAQVQAAITRARAQLMANQ